MFEAIEAISEITESELLFFSTIQLIIQIVVLVFLLFICVALQIFWKLLTASAERQERQENRAQQLNNMISEMKTLLEKIERRDADSR